MSLCPGDRCVARLAIKSSKFKIDPAVPGLKEDRYKATQCAAVCAKNSDLCKKCIMEEEQYMTGDKFKQPTWHGRIDGPIPPHSHIEGSEWNKRLRMKSTAKAAKAANSVKRTKKNKNKNKNTTRNRTNIPYSEKWTNPA